VRQIEEGVNGFAQPNGQSGSASSSRSDDPRQQLLARRATHQAELEKLDEEILKLQSLRKERALDVAHLTMQLDALNERVVRSHAVQNYFDKFEWSDRLREQLRNVFGIENFRLAQEGCVIFFFCFVATTGRGTIMNGNSVCNANMDGRDIICIMPTGQWAFRSPPNSTTI
jgi:ATP-dependent DNA helicase Q1